MLKTVSTANGLVSPTFSGDVTLSTGNLIIGTSGKGIDFSATSHPAGMTSELLNDYEEGTWTPTQGAGLTVVGAFSSAGTYTKVGRLVYVRGQVNGATSVAAAVSNIVAGNLPFTSAAQSTGTLVDGNFATGSVGVINVTDVWTVYAIVASTSIRFSFSYQI